MKAKEKVLILFGADSTVEWGRSFQIAKAMKALGHEVVYIDLPLPMTLSFLRKNAHQTPKVFQPKYGLPCARFPWLRTINRKIVGRQLFRYLQKINFSPTIIWAYAPYEPKITKILKDIYLPKVVIHDIADERVSLAESQYGLKAARMTKKYEMEIAGYSDMLVVISENLKKTKEPLHSKIIVMPNGVDTEMFAPDPDLPEPDEYRSIPGKKILYIGALEEWVDIDFIQTAAVAAPELSFVLVGPSRINTQILQGLKNIYLLGSRPYSQMPNFISHSDVCMLPFRDEEITRNSDPLKVLQYLGMGKAVVSLFYKGVKDYNGSVDISRNLDEFLQSIENHLICRDDEPALLRRSAAITYSWRTLLSNLFEETH